MVGWSRAKVPCVVWAICVRWRRVVKVPCVVEVWSMWYVVEADWPLYSIGKVLCVVGVVCARVHLSRFVGISALCGRLVVSEEYGQARLAREVACQGAV